MQHRHRNTHSVGAYWVIWPQSLGRWSSVFRVKHVEQTYLVGMFLTLRETEKENERVSASELSLILSSEPSGRKINDCHSTLATPSKPLSLFQLMMLADILPPARWPMAWDSLSFLGALSKMLGKGRWLGDTCKDSLLHLHALAP